MKYRYPDYYDQFSCVAGACKDTCCAGWQIVVDEESLERYRQDTSFYRQKLLSGISFRNEVFVQETGKRCFFLCEDNLCDMYKKLGEDSLCKTCREYPRHTEEFENVREITLCASCPEVARILVAKKDAAHFVEREDDAEEEFEDYDYFLSDVLEETRESLLSILQDRSRSVEERIGILLTQCRRLQLLYDEGELAEHRITAEWDRDIFPEDSFEASKERFRKLHALERLRDNWQELLMETDYVLYRTREQYDSCMADFAEYEKTHEAVTIVLEQMLVYFFYIYYPGAVYDGWIFGKADAVAAHVNFLKHFFAARLAQKKELTDADFEELIYRYCRETEHSDDNLVQLENSAFYGEL